MATAASATTTTTAPAPPAAPHDEEAAFEAFATCDFARALRLALAELLLGEGEDDDSGSGSESGEGEDGPAGVAEGAAEGGAVPLIPMPGTTPACSVALTEACSRCVGPASACFVDYKLKLCSTSNPPFPPKRTWHPEPTSSRPWRCSAGWSCGRRGRPAPSARTTSGRLGDACPSLWP